VHLQTGTPTEYGATAAADAAAAAAAVEQPGVVSAAYCPR